MCMKMESNMKTVIAAGMLTLAAATATAADFKVTGTVTDVSGPINSFETYEKVERVCRDVTVRSGNKGGDALGGAIVGAIIGKVITGDDSGAAAGAIFGGLVGADNSKPTYSTETVCENVTKRVRKQYYIVQYDWNGFEGEFQTRDGSYYVGQRVTLNMKLTRF